MQIKTKQHKQSLIAHDIKIKDRTKNLRYPKLNIPTFLAMERMLNK